MRTLLAILLLAALIGGGTSNVLAQQQRASDATIGGSINEIVSQRDIAQARAIEYAGKLAEAQAEIERLKKQCKPEEVKK